MTLFKKPAGILLPAIRISFALVLLNACLVLGAELLGFAPDESKFLLAARKQVSEALAIQFSIFASNLDIKNIQKTLVQIIKRNPEIESVGIRLQNRQLIFQIGDHNRKWGDYADNKSTSTHLIVPILQNSERWGNIELKFVPLKGETNSDFFQQSSFKMGSFILVIGFFVNLAFMLRTLRLLDPSAVIPDRVNAAFDTLIEGVIILDEDEQIVLVNKAIIEKLALPISSLIGKKLSTLQWQSSGNNLSERNYPWKKVLNSGKSSIGSHLMLANFKNKKVYKFVINASPIISENKVTQGVLITLDDITELEERNTGLQSLVSRLKETQAHVQQQNKELNYLATRDFLTGCLNRRAFTEQFDKAFKEAKQNNAQLTCIMADIDHFKSVNDNYGHSIGDIVIKLLADILHSNTRKEDLVARFGGEEFCVVLLGLTVEEALFVAERFRIRIKDESISKFENGPRVTASFGVSSFNDNPSTPSELINLADQALYLAKEAGRNRVIRWQPKAESINGNSDPINKEKKNIIKNEVETESIKKLQERITELESITSQFSAELEFAKNYDVVTGLPNQTLFYDRITQVIERGNRYDQIAAILVIDMGIFNQISSTLGHEGGNELLTKIAERLKAIFRKYDAISRLTISRFGDDEFAILLTDLATKEVVTWIVNRLQDRLSEAFDIDGNSIFITSHVGVSLYPFDGKSTNDLIKNAIFAKNYSKEMRNEKYYQFFDENMQKLSIKHVNLEKEIRQAIQNEEWVLLYQPKMDCKTNTIIGAEGLIRWNHPSRGLLSPFEFIDFAEQRGLIVPIGDWVIRTACEQLNEWKKIGITDCKIAVNLSAYQLKQLDFVDKTFQKLALAGVPPRQLELELTESVLINNFEVALASLKRLNSRGITIAIDDFGTGYSSLGYLKNLPIDTLKIDRTFIKDIGNDDRDKKIVKAMIDMAHSMGMKVVAEGVEDKQQFEFITQSLCDGFQGYLLSKPIPANELTEMLIQPLNFPFINYKN